MKPAKHVAVEGGIPIGNVYDKYHTRNPVARRLMDGFLAGVTELVGVASVSSAHEVGCGEGHLAVHLAGLGLRVRASDFSTRVVAQARETVAMAGLGPDDVALEVASVYELTPAEHAAPLIVCCEVLEHLDRPGEALDRLAALADPYLLVSVPREPLWRLLNVARGKYLRHLGNTPGHLQHWSRHGFLRFLSRRFEVVAARSPLPWTMALCTVRRAASR